MEQKLSSIKARSFTAEEEEQNKKHNEDEATLLYLCVSKGIGGCKWLIFNPISGYYSNSDAMNSENTPLFCGCAVVRSTIYIVGGQKDGLSITVPSEPTKSVKVFDTISKTWQHGREMIAARSRPLVVFAANKIFVFGGSNQSLSLHHPDAKLKPWPADLPWAECYELDQQEQGWRSLGNNIPPPEVTESLFYHGHFVYGTNVVLWNEDKFCLYNWLKDSWCYVKLNFNNPSVGVSTRVTVLQNVLFWCYGNYMFSFDLTGGEEPIIPCCTFDSHYQPDVDYYKFQSMSPFLVGLTNQELCLVWYDYRSVGNRLCFWATFRVGKPSESHPIITEWYQKGEFPVGGIEICHCLALKRHKVDAEGHDFVRENEEQEVQDPMAFLDLLSRTMHVKNGYDHVEPVARSLHDEEYTSREVEISMDSLALALGLDGDWAVFLKKIIDKNALNCLNEDDLKDLNLPTVVRAWLFPEERPAAPMTPLCDPKISSSSSQPATNLRRSLRLSTRKMHN